VGDGFVYSSDSNTEWMPVAALQKWIEDNRTKFGDVSK
jgi:hypothetical protein